MGSYLTGRHKLLQLKAGGLGVSRRIACARRDHDVLAALSR